MPVLGAALGANFVRRRLALNPSWDCYESLFADLGQVGVGISFVPLCVYTQSVQDVFGLYIGTNP